MTINKSDEYKQGMNIPQPPKPIIQNSEPKPIAGKNVPPPPPVKKK